eukprot:TRINITY_DN5487_c0_g1_i1.p1 TRINITY_DN5487_c0_g1~~TRINITY_DN5487_c0_g1_i1.p1  ORF type:complete len:687 (-),score=187.24 TRINITY_DN5487_c0_g1_i1:24-1901(-)
MEEDHQPQSNGHSNGKPKKPSPPETIASIFRWETFLPQTKTLMSEAEYFFSQIQKLRREAPGQRLQEDLIELSRHYRAILTNQCLQLQEFVQSGQLDKEKAMIQGSFKTEAPLLDLYNEEMRTCQLAGVVWHFAEVFFLSGSEMIAPLLVDWLNINFGVRNLQLFDQMQQEEIPEDNEEYWSLVYSCLLQGQISHARGLIQLHSAYNPDSINPNDPFLIVDELLETMPPIEDCIYDNYQIALAQWQERCNGLVNLSIPAELGTVLRILVGDMEIIKEQTQTWYELMIATIIYSQPTVQKTDVREIAAASIEEYPEPTPVDSILLAMIDGDPILTIRLACQFFENWWFAAHLVDLLYQAQVLEPFVLPSGVDFREAILLEYASVLFSHESMWNVAASYLGNCRKFGKVYLERLVEKQRLENDTKTLKLLNLCNVHNLTETNQYVCKIAGMNKLKKRRFAAAVMWLMKAKDIRTVSIAADKILQHYSETGTLEQIDVMIETLGPDFIFSPKLTFVDKYRQIQSLWKVGDYESVKSAAKLTIQLMSTNVAPKQFWLTLIYDLFPLFEAVPVMLDVADVTLVMHCMEEIALSHRRDEYLKMKNLKEEDIQILRMAISRNMARAIVVNSA